MRNLVSGGQRECKITRRFKLMPRSLVTVFEKSNLAPLIRLSDLCHH